MINEFLATPSTVARYNGVTHVPLLHDNLQWDFKKLPIRRLNLASDIMNTKSTRGELFDDDLVESPLL